MPEKDDIQGLPDVDLSPVIQDLQNQEGQQQQQQQVAQVVPDQFKTDADRQKAYKELQAAFTRVSQEHKTTKQELAQLREELELARLATYQQPQQQYIPQQQQDQQQPQLSLEQMVQQQVTVQTIASVLEDEADKNRGEFQERYAYAQAVSRQYPQLTRTSKGVRKLFELGDKLRQENLKRNAGRALESIFGGPLAEEEINKLRTFVKGDKAVQQQLQNTNAYMPDTSTSTKSGSDQNQLPNMDQQINESVKKGDVDGVIQGMFKKILAE